MKRIETTPASRAALKTLARQLARQERIKQSKQQCEDFNATNPIGTKVIVSMYGRTLTTKTNSSAMVNLSGHAWVGVDLITYPVLIGSVEVVR